MRKPACAAKMLRMRKLARAWRVIAYAYLGDADGLVRLCTGLSAEMLAFPNE